MVTNDQTDQQSGEKDIQRVPCNKNRILIVDDEKLIRQVFEQVLSYGLPNCRLDLAVNGAEAVEYFRTAHQGIVLMDLRMPVMDGETAFTEIQKICQAENWDMPSVVFCTGYNPSDKIRKAVANNRAHYLLLKPVSTDILLEVLKSKLAL